MLYRLIFLGKLGLDYHGIGSRTVYIFVNLLLYTNSIDKISGFHHFKPVFWRSVRRRLETGPRPQRSNRFCSWRSLKTRSHPAILYQVFFHSKIYSVGIKILDYSVNRMVEQVWFGKFGFKRGRSSKYVLDISMVDHQCIKLGCSCKIVFISNKY